MGIEVSEDKKPGRVMKQKPRKRRGRRGALNPLTERILSQMGPEGEALRQRLRQLYRRCNLQNSWVEDAETRRSGGGLKGDPGCG